MKYFWFVVSALWALVIFRLTTTPQMVVTQDSILQAVFMMGAHFFFFGMQAVLLYFSFKPLIHEPASLYLPLFLASVYGAVIEFLQLRVPGRSGDPVDWILDTLGAVILLYSVRKYMPKQVKGAK